MLRVLARNIEGKGQCLMAEKEGQPAAPEVEIIAEDTAGRQVTLHGCARSKYPERFCTMFQPTMKLVATWDRPPAYHRTLLHLLGILDPVQWRSAPASAIAAATGLSAPSVERAFSMLLADQLIFTQGRTASRKLRLNNRLVWMSTVRRYLAANLDPMPEDARGR